MVADSLRSLPAVAHRRPAAARLKATSLRSVSATSAAPYRSLGAATCGSLAFGINSAGRVVGNDGNQAVLWDHGTFIAIGTLGGDFREAHGVNVGGQVVGSASTADGRVAPYVWQAGVTAALQQPDARERGARHALDATVGCSKLEP